MIFEADNDDNVSPRARLEREFEKFLYQHGVRRSQQTIVWFALEVSKAEAHTTSGTPTEAEVISLLGGRANDGYQEDLSQLLASHPG